MKILFLSHKFYPNIGGIEVNSEVLANAFHQAGYEVRLLTWTEDPGYKAFLFPVIRKPALKTLIAQHRWADVVFQNNPCLRLAWPAWFFGKTSVIALRTWLQGEGRAVGWQAALKGWSLKKASAVIAVSDAIRDRCWPAAEVIGNPYRVQQFRLLPEQRRTHDFVFLGRLVSDKGADLAIHALHCLLSGRKGGQLWYQKLSLTIIGNGPERQKLEAMVRALELEDHVTFTGSLQGEALVKILNQHKYLLVPSVWEEPFGNVALEGMACGCLPIVSDGGGLPFAVGKAGLTFRRGDVNALVSCIRSLLENPQLEQQLRNAAPAHLAAHDVEAVSQRYLTVIKKAMKCLLEHPVESVALATKPNYL